MAQSEIGVCVLTPAPSYPKTIRKKRARHSAILSLLPTSFFRSPSSFRFVVRRLSTDSTVVCPRGEASYHSPPSLGGESAAFSRNQNTRRPRIARMTQRGLRPQPNQNYSHGWRGNTTDDD
jgi:hypothetical protein